MGMGRASTCCVVFTRRRAIRHKCCRLAMLPGHSQKCTLPSQVLHQSRRDIKAGARTPPRGEGLRGAALPGCKDTPGGGEGTAEAVGQGGHGLRSPLLHAPEPNQPGDQHGRYHGNGRSSPTTAATLGADASLRALTLYSPVIGDAGDVAAVGAEADGANPAVIGPSGENRRGGREEVAAGERRRALASGRGTGGAGGTASYPSSSSTLPFWWSHTMTLVS